jgi:hypothetical protein
MSKVIADWHPIEPLAIHQPPAKQEQFGISQPDAMLPEPTYEQRREEIAKRRNPNRETWFWFNETIPCTNEGSEGVARAVANLNRHENRLGASRWQP